jgi:hypothetical protein
MKLVNEDEHGAYLSVRKEFLKEFTLKENNPNFEVYDSNDGNNRFIVTKASRLPDDEDINIGRYGINFHRANPDFNTAKAYHEELTMARVSRQALNSLAFAASTKEQYDDKSATWERFYSYIWDEKPQNVWVTPHSGSVERAPDDIFPYPKLELDAYAAGTAAQCVLRDTAPATKRTMVSVHSHNWFSGVIDIGGLGVNDEKKLTEAAAKIEAKYGDRVQSVAEACLGDFMTRVMLWLEHVFRIQGTLDPQQLSPASGIDWSVVYFATRGLKLYGRKVTRFTLEEFREAIESLKGERVRVVSCNYLFSGQQVGKQLALQEHIKQRRLDRAVQIECMKYYLKHERELVTDIILDYKHELLHVK